MKNRKHESTFIFEPEYRKRGLFARYKTLKNKLLAIVFMAIGVASIFLENDGTVCLFIFVLAVPMFFAKKDMSEY